MYRGTYRGAPVAVKCIVDPAVTPVQTAEFMAELHVMAGLRHPAIVRLLGACTTPPRQFFVMELAGQSLFDVLHGTTPEGAYTIPAIPLAHRLSFLVDAAGALHHCHTRRPALVHRDVKTANLLVVPPPPAARRPSGGGGAGREGLPHAKLCDFGLVGCRTPDAG